MKKLKELKKIGGRLKKNDVITESDALIIVIW